MFDEKLYNERLERMDAALKGRIPDRVPVLSIVDNWAIFYSGYSLQEILEDENKHINAYYKVLSDFPWDVAFFNVLTRNINFTNLLGGGGYSGNTKSIQVDTSAIECMTPEDYPELIKDPVDFILNVVAKRKYKLFQAETDEERYAGFCSAMDALFDFRKIAAKANAKVKENLSLPMVRPAGFSNPCDLLLDFLRNFAGTMSDIKRRPQMVIDACEALTPFVLDNVKKNNPPSAKACCAFNPLHTPEFLSPRDFEKVYWPSFKRIIDDLTDSGYFVTCYFEKNFSHLYDYLAELPEGKVAGLFEEDDLSVVKRRVPNITVIGGMDCFTLNYGTKEDCIDMAKRLLSEVAPGGKYVFAPNKIMHSENDAKPENLLAVNEYIMLNGNY